MAQGPMYLKIAADIREQIDTGALGRGAQLPTEADLSETYCASRNTISAAIKCLTSQGLVETRPGQGRFVTMRIDPLVTMLSGDAHALGGAEGAMYLSDVGMTHRRTSFSYPKVEVQVPPTEISRRLRIAPRAPVVSRHQARYVDEIPWSLQTSFYPMDFINKGATRLLLAEDIVEGAVTYLAEALGIMPGRLPRLDHRTKSRPERAGVLWSGARCHRFRDFPYRIRPDRNPTARNGHGFSGRPQPVHHQRRGRTRPLIRGRRGKRVGLTLRQARPAALDTPAQGAEPASLRGPITSAGG